ncbi:response regulator transcription factor [Amycolatopsis sp.]|uniref:response regulator transcription factor n=1 Tax=Amycolatopsis sp. TaxID=37632 RepID=UPI002C000FFA|nr:response regulator transcription factor [Amycolatopsis sp.]HVV12152.1 response regulator transcription factor [Amycolatopsis sp.]
MSARGVRRGASPIIGENHDTGGRSACFRHVRARPGSVTARLLVAGESVLIRQALRHLLDTVPDVDWAGESELRADRLAQGISAAGPDVVVLHAQPGSAALSACYAVCAPLPTVLLTSARGIEADLPRAVRAGVQGFVDDDEDPDQLLSAIRAVSGGGAWISPPFARHLLTHYRQHTVEQRRVATPGTLLSSRERGVIRLIAQGLSNSEIAAELTLAESTVKTHISRVLRKLGLRDRTQLALYAYENDLL